MKKLLYFILPIALLLALVACGKDDSSDSKKEVSLDTVYEAIKEAIAEDLKEVGIEEPIVDGKLEAYVEVDLLNTTEENEFFAAQLELDTEKLEAGYMIAPMMNINSDEIILLQAKEESEADALVEALEKRLEAQEKTWSEYLPDQYEKVKKNIIKKSGKYLIYITYEDPEKIEAIFDEQIQ